MTIQRKRILLVGVIIAGCVGLDQATKAVALAMLPPRTLHLFGDLIRLHLSSNAGAFLSLGAGLPPALRFWVFTVLSLAMVLGVAFYALTTEELPHDAIIALAFLAGGGLSNQIDRLLRDGHVVDFLNFGIGTVRTGILNLADIAITFGALYTIWAAFRSERW